MPSLIEEAIVELSNGEKPLLNSRLIDLSNLNGEEINYFEQVWVAIEPKQRREIISRLVKLAEDNLELNFDSIFKSCLKDQDIKVRSKAIEGLWENEEPSLISPLIGLLERDRSEEVQVAAATALGKFAMLMELNKLRSCYMSRVGEALLAVINDQSRPVEVGRRALEAAAPLSLPEVEKAIMTAYQSHNAKLKASAIYAMGKNCSPSWLSILLKELTNTDGEMRYEAAIACGEIGELEAVPNLIGRINDPDIEVQMAAIQALGKIGGAEARECLEECLDDPSEAIQQAAEQAKSALETDKDQFPF